MARRRKGSKRRVVRSSRRSTRKGQIRRTSRRAFQPKRKAARRRRNPTMGPAIRYGLSAATGAIVGQVIDSNQWLSQLTAPLDKAVPAFNVRGSLLGAGLTWAISEFGLRGENKKMGRAAALGMLVPTVSGVVGGFMAPKGGAYGYGRIDVPQRHRLRAPQSNAASSFVRQSAALDNLA